MVLLMIEILHAFEYHSPTNYGSMVCILYWVMQNLYHQQYVPGAQMMAHAKGYRCPAVLVQLFVAFVLSSTFHVFAKSYGGLTTLTPHKLFLDRERSLFWRCLGPTSINQPTYLPAYLPTCLPTYLSTFLSTNPSIYLSIYPCIYLCVV